MKRSLFKIMLGMAACCVLAVGLSGHAGSQPQPKQKKAGRTLPIEEFIVLATRNDTYFEEVLIDEMKLQYHKALYLPAGDIVLSVKSQYNFLLSNDKEKPDLTIGLSKLFPSIGTDVSASYKNVPAIATGAMGSEFNVMISQPIAENAFGHATRLYDKILGLEIDVARYQVVEAYEDYFAEIISLYYDWFSVCENLKIAQSSYDQNKKLLDNMLERSRQKIALPVDVNKVKLQVLGKEEQLIETRQTYQDLSNLIMKAIRYEGKEGLVPADPFAYQAFTVDFEKKYQTFTESSRTYEILSLLEKESSLEVRKNASELLPSTNLLVGYKEAGSKWRIENEENLLYAGVSIEWPFPDQEERAQYETARVDRDKRQLTNQNTYLQLYTDLKNLYLEIQREEELIELAAEKIFLGESVLEYETRNYSYGKITLNDYIDAVNKLDEYRFSRISHNVQLHKLLTEWRRLTDSLVGQNVLKGFQN